MNLRITEAKYNISDFQTPKPIIRKLLSRLDIQTNETIFEPTEGGGNIVSVLKDYGYPVESNNGKDFFDVQPKRYNWIIGNPPFTPFSLGYRIFERCFDLFLSENGTIVFLLPWNFLINSTARIKKYFPYIAHIYLLDRTIFRGSRVQTAFFLLTKKKQYEYPTISYLEVDIQ